MDVERYGAAGNGDASRVWKGDARPVWRSVCAVATSRVASCREPGGVFFPRRRLSVLSGPMSARPRAHSHIL